MYEQCSFGQAIPRMQALAFIYDHASEFPSWVQHLTPKQTEQLAAILTRWKQSNEEHKAVQTIEDIEKREFTRALVVCRGDVCDAAKALGIGKTTLYRRLKQWGYSPSGWRVISQAAALACVHNVDDVRGNGGAEAGAV